MKYIGIITAENDEYEAIRKILDEEAEIQTINGTEVLIGKIQTKDCIIALSGVGKVNVARMTQLLLDNFDIEYIINVGISCSLTFDLNIGDIVIGKTVVQHDFDITAFGHSKGFIPQIGNEVDSDFDLVNSFEKALGNSEKRLYNIKTGIVATGDIFVTEIAMQNKISAKFRADCADMEGAAIAQVCKLNNIPFIIIKSISNSSNGKNLIDYRQNLKLASKRIANVIREFFIRERELDEIEKLENEE